MAGNTARVRDLLELAEVWEGLGLRAFEFAGWEDRGRSSTIDFKVLGVHHTGSAFDVDRVLIEGRPDLPGPLCNVALHGDGAVGLLASGRANHFGVATWSSSDALGVEATGPPFPNYRAYVRLAAGFCNWKGKDPAHILKGNLAIPVYLVAAHKEVAQPYGRKPNPAFDDPGRLIQGVRLIDTFRSDVRLAMDGEDDFDMYDAAAELRLFKRIEEAERRAARYVDHGDAAVTGSANHHKVLREELDAFRDDQAARWQALGTRLDALEELLTPEPPA
jgi:hypothetical protein